MRPLSLPAPDLARRVQKLSSILEVAKAMTAQRDLRSLLPLILAEAAKVVEADRCSLFLLDRERNELWSKVAQGASGEFRFPLGKGIAGTVAQTGRSIVSPDAYADPRFNPEFDAASGYLTRSILCVPMRDTAGEVTGVLQALNKRKDAAFDAEDEELLSALGGQAAAAIENAVLHDEIHLLFEGFVRASVVAIEARDPSTAGHSERVAKLTVALAQSLDRVEHGPYARIGFTQTEIDEIRYASLLHDFGKVGVRERVLGKAEKLYPHEREALAARFELARKDRQLQSQLRMLERLRSGDKVEPSDLQKEEDAQLQAELKRLDDAMEFLWSCNHPTVLPSGGFERLQELSGLSFFDSRGHAQPLITQQEIVRLSIPKGSLSAEERQEIESHVSHTYRFLSQIPWTRALQHVPEIAWAHHEKIDGSGYPRALRDQTIPLQSRMMAVTDIYDALTASDRPYKKAVPHALALDILHQESQAGQLDPELLRIFIEADIPRRALSP